MIFYNTYGQNSIDNNDEQIKLHDKNLKTELVISNLDFSTGMAFIGDEDFLIIEKKYRIGKEDNRWKNAFKTTKGIGCK